MARVEDMATIDLALQNDLAPPPPEASLSPSSDLIPAVVSNSELPTSLTADEKRAYDVRRQMALDQRQSVLDQEAALKQQIASQQAAQSALVSSALSTVQSARRIGRDAGIKLGAIPTPGSIALPLIVLFVFFFLLIPVNGHTRAVWLWLVISGNAEISGVSPAGGSGGSGGAPAAIPGDSGSGVNGPSGPVQTGSGGGTQTIISLPPVFSGVEEPV